MSQHLNSGARSNVSDCQLYLRPQGTCHADAQQKPQGLSSRYESSAEPCQSSAAGTGCCKQICLHVKCACPNQVWPREGGVPAASVRRRRLAFQGFPRSMYNAPETATTWQKACASSPLQYTGSRTFCGVAAMPGALYGLAGKF